MKRSFNILLLALALSTPALADEFSWTGTGGGSFWDAANWTNNTAESTQTVPRFHETGTDTDIVTISAEGQTIHDATGSNNRVFVSGGDSSAVETLNWQAGTFRNDNGAFVVGLEGYGKMNQTGGSLTIGNLYLGARALTNSNGTWTISGDSSTLKTNNLFVVERGTGVFNQDGGMVTTDQLSFSTEGTPTGTYNLNAGTLNVKSVTNSQNSSKATFNLDGGTLVAGQADAAMAVYNLNVAPTKAATLNIGGTNNFQTVTVNNLTIGANSDTFKGTVNQNNSASVTINGTLTLNSGAVSGFQSFYNLNSGTLKVNTINGTSAADNSRFVINGGSLEASSATTGSITGKLYLIVGNSGAANLVIGNSDGDTANRITNINTTSQLIIGGSAKGTLTQNGGSVTVSNIYMGAWNGYSNASAGSTYTINDGSLTVLGTIHLGERNAATIIQNNGTVKAATIAMGENNEGANGDSKYQLKGGSLTVTGVTTLGTNASRKDFIEMSGGTWTQGGAATLGQNGTGNLTMSDGTWNQNGSLLVAQKGKASIVTTGGTSNINGNVYMADQASGVGSWVIGSTDPADGFDPTVRFSKNLCIGHRGEASLTVNSGTVAAQKIYLGGDTSSNTTQAKGTLTINGGSFSAAEILYVNSQNVKANQTFAINGGEVTFSHSDFSVFNNGGVVAISPFSLENMVFDRTTYAGTRTWNNGAGLDYDPADGTGKTTVPLVSDAALPAYSMYVYKTNVYIDQPGDYWFQSQVDDYSRLFINGESVLDRSAHSAANTTEAISLNEGWTSVELRAYGNGAPNNATLKISTTGEADSFQFLSSETLLLANEFSNVSIMSIDGDYSQSEDGTLKLSVGEVNGSYTQLQAENIDLSKGRVEVYLGDSALVPGAVYDLLKATGSVTLPSQENVTMYLNGAEWDYKFWDDTAWTKGQLKIDSAAVPEPATWSLLLLGAAGVWYWRKRR